MATGKLAFNILDVFTTTKYLGNPLAIVHVPATQSVNLTQEQKFRIAREFNLSETVFLHENPDDTTAADAGVKIDIFTPKEELTFAGHPTIGSSWFLLIGPGSRGRVQEVVRLRAKGGDILATRQDSGRVRLQVPVDFKEHDGVRLSSFKSAQSNLRADDYTNGLDGAEGVASIVKGTTFVLLRLSSEDALGRLQGTTHQFDVPNLGEWRGRSVG